MIGTGLPAATKAEALRMRLIVEGGCICCWEFAEVATPCEVHHLTVGGKHGQLRRGHRFTVGICPWHHRGEAQMPATVMAGLVGPSYARQPLAFRQLFGDDEQLLRLQGLRLQQVHDSYLISPGVYA